MGVANWDQKRVSSTLSIVEDPALDHVLQAVCASGGSTKEGYLLYNGKTDFRDSEIKAQVKRVAQNVNDQTAQAFVFRSDAALDNAYLAELCVSGDGSSNIKARIEKYDAGVKSQLILSGNLQVVSDVWEYWRVRCWDVVFPASLVRFTFEKWNGATWDLIYQVDESTAFLLGVTGRSGVGFVAYNPNLAFTARVNDADLGHLV